MHYCLLKESPNINKQEANDIHNNHNHVALQGRNPQLKLKHNDGNINMQQWSLEILNEMQAIAMALDKAHDSLRYSRTLDEHKAMLLDSSQTPSARILLEMQKNKESFTAFSMRKATQHRKFYQAKKLSDRRFRYYESLSRKSHCQQKVMENPDDSETKIDTLVLDSVSV